MARWIKDYTIGDVASLFEQRIGGSADQHARRIRYVIQQDVMQPRRRGEGRNARALFADDDVLFIRLLLAFMDAGVAVDHLKIAARARDSVDETPVGESHTAGFGFVIEAVERGEPWFFNLHLSRTGQHGASFARQPETIGEPFEPLATVTLPCEPLLGPLLDEDAAAQITDTVDEPIEGVARHLQPISREDEPHTLPAPPKVD